MSKIREWYVLNKVFFQTNEKSEVINKIAKDLNIKYSSARNYYIKIREEFVNECGLLNVTENIKNTSLKILKRDKDKIYLQGRYSDYLKKGTTLVAGEHVFKSESEIEEWAKEEVSNFLNDVVPEIIYTYNLDI